MISSLKDERGKIEAYIEYDVVDAEGKLKNGGEYGFIRDLWIHKMCRSTGFNPSRWALKALIKEIDDDPRFASVKWIYWLNKKMGERQTHCFSRNRLSKMGEYHGQKKFGSSKAGAY